MKEQLRYAVGDSALGKVLVAEGNRGIRIVLIEQTEKEALRGMRAACPDADIQQSAKLHGVVKKIIRHIENPKSPLDIKLDLRGNDFQMKVWNALRKIPAGKTVSYGELARKIGAPGAARAVGGACGANILAIVVPCHRVITSTGSLSGYRWGVKTKRRLLEMERAA